MKHKISRVTDLIYQVLPCTATFELGQNFRYNKKFHIDDLIVTAWWPMSVCTNFRTNVTWGLDLKNVCKTLYSKETIFFLHIKCKLLQFIHKTVDVSHLQYIPCINQIIRWVMTAFFPSILLFRFLWFCSSSPKSLADTPQTKYSSGEDL